MADYDKETENKQEVSEEDINAVLQILENFGKSEEGRLKVRVSDEVQSGQVAKVHHLGRCDVGSPWARGQAFDVLEEDQRRSGCDGGDYVAEDDGFTMDLEADEKKHR